MISSSKTSSPIICGIITDGCTAHDVCPLLVCTTKNVVEVALSRLAAVDTKPPKAMIHGQKCRDRARKEMVQMVYTQSVLDQFTGTTDRSTPRGRSSQSARSTRLVQSQVHAVVAAIRPISTFTLLADDCPSTFEKCSIGSTDQSVAHQEWIHAPAECRERQ